MKRYKFFVTALLLGLFYVLPMEAQWRVGVSGGGDYNWYLINTNYQTDYRYDGAWGWNAAVFGQYDFLPWVGLRAELEASERNYRFYRTGIYSGTNYTMHNTYVQIPVMAQFRFGEGKVHGFVHVGAYAGYWIASREKGAMTDPMTGIVQKINQPYRFNAEKDQRTDFGLAGGLGLEYQCARHWAIHIEGRCYYSFVSTVKPYMVVRDSRYNTTIGMNIGCAYIF